MRLQVDHHTKETVLSSCLGGNFAAIASVPFPGRRCLHGNEVAAVVGADLSPIPVQALEC